MIDRNSNPKILDGKLLANSVCDRLTDKVRSCVAAGHRPPGLAVVLVGEDPASQTYVRNKERRAAKCGFFTLQHSLPANVSQGEVLEVLGALNADPRVDGILLQLPVPKHLDADELLAAIDPWKDADGLHSLNQGYLVRGQAAKVGAPIACTPAGVLKLIDYALSAAEVPTESPVVSLAGLRAVVIGRSILVGKPTALLLLERDASVSMIHSKTKNPAAISADADIIVAAAGMAGLVTAEWVKEGAVLIDVGTNRLPDGRLVGDVDFEGVKGKCRAITPVPGGVGPMTIAMLLHNTFSLFERRESLLHRN